MPYFVRWQLVGRSQRRIDSGYIREVYEEYGDAAEAASEFLRSYPEVDRCDEEAYWLARRSADADRAVWVWVEQHEDFAVHMPELAMPLSI